MTDYTQVELFKPAPKSEKERQAKRRAHLLSTERAFSELVTKLTEIKNEAFRTGNHREGFFEISSLLSDLENTKII